MGGRKVGMMQDILTGCEMWDQRRLGDEGRGSCVRLGVYLCLPFYRVCVQPVRMWNQHGQRILQIKVSTSTWGRFDFIHFFTWQWLTWPLLLLLLVFWGDLNGLLVGFQWIVVSSWLTNREVGAEETIPLSSVGFSALEYYVYKINPSFVRAFLVFEVISCVYFSCEVDICITCITYLFKIFLKCLLNLFSRIKCVKKTLRDSWNMSSTALICYCTSSCLMNRNVYN